MPTETFKLTLSACGVQGNRTKTGEKLTITVAFSCQNEDNVNVTWYFSGPEEAMKKTFGSWPINFDDVKTTTKNPIMVDATLATAGPPTVAAQANALASQAAAQAPVMQVAPTLDGVGAEINKLAQ